MKHVYTAWFRNPALPADDHDYEWPACFVVEADEATRALRWGDKLAVRYAESAGQQFLSSTTEAFESAAGDVWNLPVVAYGHDASDEEIGW